MIATTGMELVYIEKEGAFGLVRWLDRTNEEPWTKGVAISDGSLVQIKTAKGKEVKGRKLKEWMRFDLGDGFLYSLQLLDIVTVLEVPPSSGLTKSRRLPWW